MPKIVMFLRTVFLSNSDADVYKPKIMNIKMIAGPEVQI